MPWFIKENVVIMFILHIVTASSNAGIPVTVNHCTTIIWDASLTDVT